MDLDLGLLLLRVLLAALLLGHSTQKLFGWFSGAGPRGTGKIFEQWGFSPGPRMAVIAGLFELLGALSILFGLLLPGGAAVIIGTMIVAAAATASGGFWAQQGGCEVPVCYAALATILAVTGPGTWSLDHALGLAPLLSGPGWGLAALAVGAGAATVPLLLRRRVLRARTTNTEVNQ